MLSAKENKKLTGIDLHSKEAFLEFFHHYYSQEKKMDLQNLKLMASRLVNNYLHLPKYPTESSKQKQLQAKPPQQKRRLDLLQKQDQAIKVAKERFLKKVTQKIKPVPPRSLSIIHPPKSISLPPPKPGEGNNHEMIKRIMDKRSNWILGPTQKHHHFRWQETEKGYEYRTVVLAKGSDIQLLNHFEFHSELSNKFQFAMNLKDYCEKKGLNPHEFVPTSFPIDQQKITYNNQRQMIVSFLSFYRANCPDPTDFDKQINKLGYKPTIYTDKTHELYPTLFGQENLWIFKPSNMNQGRGIHMIKNISEVFDLINKYQAGYKEILTEVKRNENNEIIKKLVYHNTLHTETFVVQKYIERPLLIKERKFDIRCYVLLTMNLQLFFFKEGQLRLATEKFNTKQINNFIHLTNNAVQFNHLEYGKEEEGNQFTYDQASKYFQIDFRKQVIEKIKSCALCVFSSVRHKINKFKRKYCFEVFGLDFILDEQFKPWLIEVNTNPSLEVTSKQLDMLFPRLIGIFNQKFFFQTDDSFRLTLDVLFQNQVEKSYFPYTGYSDQENLWDFIGPLQV